MIVVLFACFLFFFFCDNSFFFLPIRLSFHGPYRIVFSHNPEADYILSVREDMTFHYYYLQLKSVQLLSDLWWLFLLFLQHVMS